MNRLARCLLFPASMMILLASDALALPMLSVSSPASVATGSTFSVDILISDVDAGSPLNGFEFDLSFDGNLLTATSVVDGGFLLAPLFEVQNSIGAIRVEFAEVTLLPDGASGSGTLATIQFEAVMPGVSDLDLSNVLLSAPFGVAIAVAAVVDGSVSVLDPVGVIPEPSGLLLCGIGFSIVVMRVRHQSRCRDTHRR